MGEVWEMIVAYFKKLAWKNWGTP